VVWIRGGDRLDFGFCGKAGDNLRVELLAEAYRDHAIGFESSVKVFQRIRPAKEYAGTDQEYDANCNLRDDEGVAQPHRSNVAGELAPGCREDIGARGLNRGRQSETDSRNESGCQHEAEHSNVQRQRRHCDEFDPIGGKRREHRTHTQLNSRLRDDDSGKAGRYRKQDAFGQQLPDDAPASGTQGEPDANLALASQRSSEHHVRDICACQQQNETKRYHQGARFRYHFRRQTERCGVGPKIDSDRSFGIGTIRGHLFCPTEESRPGLAWAEPPIEPTDNS